MKDLAEVAARAKKEGAKLINSLKMMKNSGFLTFGIELVEENIGKIQYLIVASDCNKKNSDKILKLCKDKKIKYIITASKRELGEVFLKEEINVIGVMDKKSTRGLLS
jgi:ribosomal protein L7Ae-like RNA K-turn-binding protein